ncbi:MAG: GGDEF domain-containing protein [Gammaproteobacteria bacterium]
MRTLLTLFLTIEPDRQRLARLVLAAVETLGGNVFPATVKMASLLRRLRGERASTEAYQEVQLRLDGNRLLLVWEDQCEPVALLREIPEPSVVKGLVRRLKDASESTDPELLKRRNRQIAADLEKAKRRATIELSRLQAQLDKKKNELQESIRLAETDSLTGLLNRGAYDSYLSRAVMRSQRQMEPLCLVLLDLDKFKEINDTYGHQYGDEYLKRMARAMRSAVRENVDHVCRIGGDEFAIITFADETIAWRVAEKVLNAMEGRVSIGIAQLLPEDTVTTLLQRADTVLYQAKRAGRGRVVVAKTRETAPTHTAATLKIEAR